MISFTVSTRRTERLKTSARNPTITQFFSKSVAPINILKKKQSLMNQTTRQNNQNDNRLKHQPASSTFVTRRTAGIIHPAGTRYRNF